MNVGVRTVNNYGVFRDICRVRACPHGVEASTGRILKPRGGIYNYFLLKTVEEPWLTRNNRPRCSQHLDHSLRWSRRKPDDHHLLAPLHSKDEWSCYWARRSSSCLPTMSPRRISNSLFLRQVLYDRTMIFQCLLICWFIWEYPQRDQDSGCENHLLTPENQEKLTTQTRSLMVRPIRVPWLSRVFHWCPGTFRIVVYPGVRIVEGENLCHPDGQGNPFQRLETKKGSSRLRKAAR